MMLRSSLLCALIVAAPIIVGILVRGWWQHRRRALQWSAHRTALRALSQGPNVMPHHKGARR